MSADNFDAAAFGESHITKGIGRLSKHVFEDGKGSWITTDKGVKLLDMTSGIGVCNLGHCHPKVTEAAAKQCGKITHAQVNIGFSATQIELIQHLLPILPHPSLDTVFFWNSGAEAVEAAVKLARAATKKQNIVVMQGSYHGRTAATAAMTRSKTIYGEGHGPLMPGVFATAFPFYSHFGVSVDTDVEELVRQSLHQLRLTLQQQTAPSDTAAIIIEPVIGEGGYVPAPPSFLHGLREICDENDLLLICDEVQSGFGRTGTMFAVEHSGVRPDVLIFAKGIANGFPLSGIASTNQLMSRQKPGSMGGTYAGNAVSCAAATAVIKAFKDEKVLDNVAARSEQLIGFLQNLQKQSEYGHLIEDVRGRGLMIGVQFANTKTNSASQNKNAAHGGNKPDHMSAKIVAECLKRDMLLLSTSVFDVLRFIPPLNISEEDLNKACNIFKQSFEAAAQQLGH
ncbi:probable 4-aminobutyrate aminotransferase [Melanopsichium pennsylvanicum]|uniref:Probable 4-aminobutyrate aminotransferase n=2 Tax=Melanopsichium pennsylvanicum TaxID=63383 RepID=A0AAJ5C3A9_9BASI|nr:probable 4-aminobutyrate aminotransferase [Melanopsichium pennsylvanicum 4]SNX82426.1 probable 4-aminobutyrate aminotransferase [Melanopsichium pennsylvanicum]